MSKKLSPEFIDRVIKHYKSLNCRYYVLKLDDLFNSMTEQNYFDLQEMLQQYNEYREEQGKDENYYYVLNSDEYPQFKSSDEFVETMESLFRSRSKKTRIETFFNWSGVTYDEVIKYIEEQGE